MASSTPVPSGDPAPRPLPRGGRVPARSTRLRFQAADAAWIAVATAIFCGLAWHENLGPAPLACGTGSVVLIFLIGRRTASRTAGIVAALLTATSMAFSTALAGSAFPAAFTLLALGSLFAFAAGSSLAALVLAALAATFRPDGLVLGLALLLLSLAQRRQRAWLGGVLFIALGAGAIYLSIRIHAFAWPHFGLQAAQLRLLAAPASLFLLWFLFPFCGELGEPARRARWLPVVLWAILSLLFVAAVHFGGSAAASAAPFLPVLFLLIGGGVARLLPALAGDIPAPGVRILLAVLAVAFLIALRAATESRVLIPR